MSEAKKRLEDVKHDERFKLSSGEEIKNLNELLGTLESISQETFGHHVSAHKNDFASWVRHSIGDDELAHSMETTTDIEATKDLVRVRISYLESQAQIDARVDEVVMADEADVYAAQEDHHVWQSDAASAKQDTASHDRSQAGLDHEFASLLQEIRKDNPMIKDRAANNPAPAKQVLHQEPVFEQALPNDGAGRSGSPVFSEHAKDASGAYMPSDAPPAQDAQAYASGDKHPFEHVKSAFLITLRDILIGVVIGLVIGYVIGTRFV